MGGEKRGRGGGSWRSVVVGGVNLFTSHLKNISGSILKSASLHRGHSLPLFCSVVAATEHLVRILEKIT